MLAVQQRSGGFDLQVEGPAGVRPVDVGWAAGVGRSGRDGANAWIISLFLDTPAQPAE